MSEVYLWIGQGKAWVIFANVYNLPWDILTCWSSGGRETGLNKTSRDGILPSAQPAQQHSSSFPLLSLHVTNSNMASMAYYPTLCFCLLESEISHMRRNNERDKSWLINFSPLTAHQGSYACLKPWITHHSCFYKVSYHKSAVWEN